jgi:hypothetical protein
MEGVIKSMKLIDVLIYVKLCVNRAYGHFSVPLNIFSTVITLAILLKLNNASMWISVFMGFLVFGLLLLIGIIDLKMGVYSRENSIQNIYNPELQIILQQQNKVYKKK